MEIMESVERDERAMERIATAMESIADSYVAIYKLMAEGLEKFFPSKHEPRESTVTRLPNEEDRLRASLGSTGEQTNEDWMQLGPREREFVEKSSESAKTAVPPKKKD
jgi:hypothetical protein